MSTLYRPVLIESVEQAEALPVGTVIHRNIGDRTETGSRANIPDGSTFDGGFARWTSEAAIGWTALVPIEAEEEWAAEFDSGELYMNLDQDSARNADGGAAMSRLVTPWEEA